MPITTFEQYFDCIDDPLQFAKVTHKFTDILFLFLCATIAGANGWEDIEDFGDLHIDWFRDKGLFINGVPTHDTIARVVSRVAPLQLL